MAISGQRTAAERERVLSAQRKRWEFLRHLYNNHEEIPSGQIQSVQAYDVGSAIGLTDRAEVDRTFTYLKDAGLIKFMSMGPNVAITKAGIDAVERALAAPDEPTSYFAPINVISVTGGIHESAIQQGTHSSSQTVASQTVDWDGLQAMLPAIRSALGGLSGDTLASAEADIATVEAQSKSPSPRTSAVRECLLSLRSVLERAGGSVIGDGITRWLRAQGWT